MKCQFCGAEIPAGDQFCGQCGARAPIDAAGGAPPAPPASGQRFDPPPAGQEPAFGTPASSQQPLYTGRWEDRASYAAAPRHRYAGWWIRFGAYILDSIFALLLSLIPAIVLAVILALLVEAGHETAFSLAEQERQDEETGNAAVIGFLVAFIPIYYGYQYVSMSLGGGWGKRICGLRIVNMDTGARPGWGSGAIRLAAVIGIGFVPFASLLDYLWPIWDSDKQTFHDKAASTVVIHK